MFGDYFYNQTTRRVAAVFGTLFNDIKVGRLDGNGDLVNQQRVPLAYGPRQKYLQRVAERPDLDAEKVAIKLPRMSFEYQAPIYDSERQRPKLNTFRCPETGKVWMPAPYRIPFELNIMARNEDEALQIVEQILPYFKPSLGVTVKSVKSTDNIIDEIRFILQSISKEDTYEGFEQKRVIIYTLTFDAVFQLYGRVDPNAKVIKKVIVDINDFETLENIETITTSLDPEDANEDDEYTIEVAIT